jgi:hypothetical protein
MKGVGADGVCEDEEGCVTIDNATFVFFTFEYVGKFCLYLTNMFI